MFSNIAELVNEDYLTASKVRIWIIRRRTSPLLTQSTLGLHTRELNVIVPETEILPSPDFFFGAGFSVFRRRILFFPMPCPLFPDAVFPTPCS